MLRLIVVNLIRQSQAVLNFDAENLSNGEHQYHFEGPISEHVMNAKDVNGSP
jgi:hypothetical protein